MYIVMTTLNREENQRALDQIPPELHDKVYLYTREDRAALLQANVPTTITVRPLPLDTFGIAQTRQRAIDATPKGKVWVIDDLCKFLKRTISNGKPQYQKVTPQDFHDLYDTISRHLDKYAQAAISAHYGNNRCLTDTATIGRAYSTYGIRTDVMERANIRFDAMYRDNPAHMQMEDFYITLDMLTKGYANIIIYNYCFQYQHNHAGGNSTHRTTTTHGDSAIELHRRFPKYVRLVRKEGKWGTQEMADRLEIAASWKKAYQSSKTRKGK